MILKKNLFANYVGATLIIITPIVTLPWYLKLLGSEQFGLLSLANFLQTLLGLIDAGISQALIREFSIRFEKTPYGFKRCANLLSGFERIYWIITITMTFLILISSQYLIKNWLNNDYISQENNLDIALYGAIGLFVVQFPGCVYRGFLIGSENHILFNKILSSSIFFRSFFGLILLNIWPSLTTFFIWNFFVSFIEILLKMKFSWKILYPEMLLQKRDYLPELRKVQSNVTKLSLSVFLGALITNIDKIILSHIVPIKEFGYYVIATTIATGLLQTIYPLIQTLLPIASKLVNERQKLKKLYIKTSATIFLIFSSISIFILYYGEFFIQLWLKIHEAVYLVNYFLQFLLIGSFINALYNIGYVNWLAQNKISNILYVNIVGLITSLIFTPIFIHWYGTVGAAISWIAVSTIGFFMSIGWLWKT